MSDAVDRQVDQAIERYGGTPDRVVPLLHAVQDTEHYLPESALKRIAEHTQIAPAELVGVATFFDHFRHEPAGAHCLRVCHGTACHVRGSQRN